MRFRQLETQFVLKTLFLQAEDYLMKETSDPQDNNPRDFTQWSLPDLAISRLGKGAISGEIAFSPDGSRLAVSGSIGIWIYDAYTGAEIALITGHTESINSVAFTPNGFTIASGSDDNTIRLWDAHTGEHRQTLKGHTGCVSSVAFSSDETYAC